MVFSKEFTAQQLASALPLLDTMAHLYLVKGNKKGQDAPRRGRASAVPTERRYRYPSEEVWQVSEDKWQVAEAHYPPQKQAEGFRPKA